MIAIFFGTVAVNAMNDYTGLAVAPGGRAQGQAADLGRRSSRSSSFLATLYLYYNNFSSTVENFLLFITYWIGPWAAVVLVDWRLGAATGSTAAGSSTSRCCRAGSIALVALVVGFVVVDPVP